MKLTPEQLAEFVEWVSAEKSCKLHELVETSNLIPLPQAWARQAISHAYCEIEVYRTEVPRLLAHIAALESDSKNAYEKGRLDEAEITIENMRKILEEYQEAPKDSHLRVCIHDLEDALKGADEE